MPRGKEPTWPVQQLILELLVIHGDQPVVIQRSLDALINQRGLTEGTPGIKWIERTIAKLQELPLDVLAKLPPSVWEKRHDYNAIRDELERSELQREQESSGVGIEFDHDTDLGYHQYEGLPVVRKFACVRVIARRGIARCCEGTLKVVAAEDARRELFPESKLQWFNKPYNEAVKPVDIISSEQLCVVFTEIPAGQIVMRPDRGVVIYPPMAQTIAPNKIPACPSSRQWVKLDILPIRVIGRRESMDWHRVTPREGAWIGTPMALNSPGIAHQDYLPPGQYDIKVRVRCDGGDEERFFRVQSPRAWDSEKPLEWRDLQMMEL